MREGTVVGDRYEIGGLIGRGGFGEVWEAADRNLPRRVAVKFLTIGDRYPDAAARFTREGSMLATLHHPGIVTIHDTGTLDHDGARLPYLVMERLTGATWEGGAPVPAVVATGAQVAEALAHAHAAEIVHRDVKPANVMVGEDGRVVLMDFGIARDDASRPPNLTPTAVILGTPAYMAPEQLGGLAAGPASDVYALGVVLVEKFTGQRTPAGQLGRTERERIPRRLRGLVAEMTGHEPGARPTAAACAERLRAFASLPSPARSPAAGGGDSSVARHLGALKRLRVDRGSGVTRVLPARSREPGEPRVSRVARWGAAVGRLRGRRSTLEWFAGGVILAVRLIRDALILAAAGTATWFLSRGFVAAFTALHEDPPVDKKGDSQFWPAAAGVGLGHLVALGITWSFWWFLTTNPRLGRSVFAKHVVRTLIASVAPLPYLAALGLPPWTSRAVPAAVWGAWLLYITLRRLQSIDTRARTRARPKK